MDDIDQRTFVRMKSDLPARLFERHEGRFLISVVRACSLLTLSTWICLNLIPFSTSAIPLWILYSIFNGTVAVGLWILAHECGHGAMSKKQWLNDLVGYPLHTFLLVPYFSWQYSHSVHHSRTNHLTEGEAHVPYKACGKVLPWSVRVREYFGDSIAGVYFITASHLFGWPMYLLTGLSGGLGRGTTNHFIPSESNKLFPRKWYLKVWLSTAGIVAMLAFLGYMSQLHGFWRVTAVYGGPYLVVNAWMILYTYLHHTDEDTPHYDSRSWNWTKGALCTIERNYPDIINWLHFDVGSSHVVHHLFSTLPHYNAREARAILEKKYERIYRVDHRPVWEALYATAKRCAVVKETPGQPGEWCFTNQIS